MHRKIILDNGLRLVVNPLARRDSIALGIWINTGGRYEKSRDKGIAHFLEHLLFKGSKKFSCRQIKESIEGVGGSLNGFTSEELTCFLVKMPQEYLVRGLEVLSDMVLEPLLESREIEKEKTVVIEEIKMYKDQPQSYVYELLDGLMWPGQPLGEPIIGSAESVSGFNRERLARFQNDCYTAQNIVISAAGALDCDKLRKKVRSIFSGLNRGCRNMFIPACQKQLEPKLNIFFKDTEQTHMAMGFHSFSRSHRLRHALSILHIILGANMSSRLFEQVREKRGLAYEIGTAIKRFADTGAFIVHAGIDNRKVEPAIELILSQLRKARTKKVSVGEFRRAKEFYLGQLRLALEDTLDYMLWLGEQEATLGQPYRLEQVIEEVNKVTRGNIIEAAKLVFQNRGFSLALIGPLKAAQEKIRKKLCIN